MAAGIAVVLASAAFTMGDRSPDAVPVDALPTRSSGPRPTTTTSLPPDTTTTAAPATTTVPPPEPTTSAPPPTVLPAAATAPTPTTTAAGSKGPISVLVVGDSLGFTAAFPPPNATERPWYLSRVDVAAVPACGLLSSAGWTAVDVENDRPDSFGMCPTQALREIGGLRRHPNWMVMFSGGWEHLPWIPPGATTPLAARSPEMRTAIFDELVRRASGALAIGTRTAFVTWVCPAGVTPTRAGDYVAWYNDILREVTRTVPGTIVIEPTDRVCVNGDATGMPTAEKNAAFGGAYHPQDKAWLWRVWLGPVLIANS